MLWFLCCIGDGEWRLKGLWRWVYGWRSCRRFRGGGLKVVQRTICDQVWQAHLSHMRRAPITPYRSDRPSRNIAPVARRTRAPRVMSRARQMLQATCHTKFRPTGACRLSHQALCDRCLLHQCNRTETLSQVENITLTTLSDEDWCWIRMDYAVFNRSSLLPFAIGVCRRRWWFKSARLRFVWSRERKKFTFGL